VRSIFEALSSGRRVAPNLAQMKRTFDKKLVLVTGAGSGIGRATALAFANAGAKLVLVDLDEASAGATASSIRVLGGDASAYRANVADFEAVRALAETVRTNHGVLDVLVNNAGIGSAGRFLDTSLETWRKVLDVNLMGVVHGCKAFLPAMVERGDGGHVVNLASLAGYVAPADMSIYATSKFAVLGFSESLRADMARHRIGVTAICPGVIHTGIVNATILEGDPSANETRAKIDSFYKKRGYGPEKVASAILDAVRGNEAVRPVSPESWTMYYAKRIAPGMVGRLSSAGNPFFKR
jgi:NAD(P)-dependent dehydrogenase (short-subunit alcohol dehydrogenase family)